MKPLEKAARIVLTEVEKEALRRSAKYLKERGEYLSNGKMRLDAFTLEYLLARAEVLAAATKAAQ